MRRDKRRRFRYRPGRENAVRRARLALRVIAIAALALSASVILRSIRTKQLNRELAGMHTVDGEAPTVQVAAPASVAEDTSVQADGLPEGLALMGQVDGSPIVPVASAQAVVAAVKYHETMTEILPEMRKLLDTNSDLVGWLTIDGIVNLPVVCRDNSYYLKHDFYGRKSASGTLFLDANHPLAAGAQNLVVYGHAMHDGTMFGLLTHYQKPGYLAEHPYISFSTLWEKEDYVAFAVLMVPEKPESPGYVNFFAQSAFDSDDAFDDYIDLLRQNALQTADIDVRREDALLTLVTCVNEDRLVVVARKLRG